MPSIRRSTDVAIRRLRSATPCPTGKVAGRLWILLAAVLWSSCGLFVKSHFFDDWSEAHRGPLLAFWRATFAVLVLAPAVRRPRFHRLLVPLAVCFTVMCVAYMTAMTLTTAANAIWLQSTSPMWVFLLSLVIFRQTIARRDLIPLVFSAAGIGVILWYEVQGQNLVGVVNGLVAGVAFAGVVMLMHRLHRENGAWLIAFSHGAAALVLLPWICTCDVFPSLTQLAILAVFGAFQMAVPYLCMLRGLQTIGSQEAVAIGLLEPVLMPLWVFLVGFEVPSGWTIVGGSLIMVGLLLRYGVVALLGRRRSQPVPDLPHAGGNGPMLPASACIARRTATTPGVGSRK